MSRIESVQVSILRITTAASAVSATHVQRCSSCCVMTWIAWGSSPKGEVSNVIVALCMCFAKAMASQIIMEIDTLLRFLHVCLVRHGVPKEDS